MSVLFKAFYGILTLCIVGCGGVISSNTLKKQIRKENIQNVINIAFDPSTYGEYDEETIGKDYSYYMVSPYNRNNKDWWIKTFNEYLDIELRLEQENQNFSDEFNGILRAWEDYSYIDGEDQNPNKALNKACDGVYLKEIDELESNKSDGTKKRNLNDDLWRFCSDLKRTPTYVSQDSYIFKKYKDTSIGEKKKTELISVRDPYNDKLWKWKNQEFFDAQYDNFKDKYFKQLYELKGKRNEDLSLKDKCSIAYKLKALEKASESIPLMPETEISLKADTVVKYCGLTLDFDYASTTPTPSRNTQ